MHPFSITAIALSINQFMSNAIASLDRISLGEEMRSRLVIFGGNIKYLGSINLGCVPEMGISNMPLPQHQFSTSTKPPNSIILP
ncbi:MULTISPECIES: hypothetical protein [Spirulina sp. CCY15215]|uniref:hypothetical protein n=1 Tax=Spirulina sp. CCY15215 TaxID=2767591 RepID=UPI00194F90D1|nr:hypothetical protein [Spirulina major]